MTNSDKIRVLIVDDSVFMRQAITKLLSEPDIEIIDTAKNGAEGVEKARLLKPDVITMDIEMPIMNGLQAVAQVMKTNPIPILMVSTLTSEGADATIEALSNGAVDFITKKAAFREMDSLKEELLGKIRSIYKNSALSNSLNRKKLLKSMDTSRPDTIRPRVVDTVLTGFRDYTTFLNPGRRPNATEVKLICIGISTGGPAALQEVFKALPGNIPVPILIVQHMPPFFTKSLAQRLDGLSDLSVKEAVNGDFLDHGKVYLAPGGFQMTVSKSRRISISDEPTDTLFKPCVEVMLSSAVDIFGKHVTGIIMTGMGNDGSKALKRLSDLGGYIISQDIESCVVAGMPKAVIDQKIANEIVPLNEISETIASIFGLHSKNYSS